MTKINIKNDMGSTDRFGYEWDKYNSIKPEHELQFLKWIFPFKKKDFKNKLILDAGCGIGRNSFWALKYGAKEVVAFDYDKRTVARAKENLNKFKNCTVSYQSVYNIPYKSKFDIVFSIGVIHHLEKPKIAINNLIKATKKGGIILVWVYGYEGNEWIVKYVNPIRKVTSKLPLFFTDIISTLFTIPLYVKVKTFKQKKPYFVQLSRFSFSQIKLIVLDQLIPKIANYWKKEEALSLFDKSNFKRLNAYRVNDNSWTIIGIKK